MDVATIVKDRRVQVAAIVVAALGVGYGAFHILRKRRIKKDIENKVEQLTFFDQNPEMLAELLGEEPKYVILDEIQTFKDSKELQMEDVIEEDTPEEVKIVNIFAKHGDDFWDHEAELSTRNPEKPYIIHCDEYIQSDMGFHQETVTYYAKDDILADQNDTPVYNFRVVLGELKFGHGSNDRNAVYIRNEKMKTEWEVLYHPGSYSYEVLGQQFDDEDEAELRHSQSVLKFRQE